MLVHLPQQKLISAILDVQKAVSSRTTIPILTGIKFTADSQGLHLAATDLEIGIETFIPADEHLHVEREGAVVLTARYISEIVRKMPKPQIELRVDEGWLTTIRSGKAEFTLHGQDYAEFPKLPQVEGNEMFSIPADLLKSVIRQTIVAVSNDEVRPVLTGLLLTVSGGQLKLLSTDSHRLASREVAVEASPNLVLQNVIIPGKSLQELGRLLPDSDQLVDVMVSQNQVLVQMEHSRFYSRLIEGQYPDTSRIIPNAFKTRIQVETSLFLDAVERASLIARERNNNVIRLGIAAGSVEVSCHSQDVGKVSEIVEPVNVEGEDMLIALNAKYMIDALRVVDSAFTDIEFTGPMSPFLVKPVDNPHCLHLILPVRIF
jgi:DNA polymerase-3 subunit beta